ncbi:hypothetical protein Mal4_01420 [Maioricimonas rarisocia]|uniref:Uncharacterized protein n=1 Tax=Maioricimonas rarisocia TaxID=2528026 RepID=A0A517Z038_9PLAN|nr:hypothetical protein Mal4_01420 [Maioricimonas rarisocia]
MSHRIVPPVCIQPILRNGACRPPRMAGENNGELHRKASIP